MGLMIALHTIICILLMIIILMQSGRGGGLTEHFASAENILGAKTNSFLVKSTTVLASLFLILCLTLAFLSTKKNQSLMTSTVTPPVKKSLADVTLPTATPEPAVAPTIPVPAVTTNTVTQ